MALYNNPTQSMFCNEHQNIDYVCHKAVVVIQNALKYNKYCIEAPCFTVHNNSETMRISKDSAYLEIWPL